MPRASTKKPRNKGPKESFPGADDVPMTETGSVALAEPPPAAAESENAPASQLRETADAEAASRKKERSDRSEKRPQGGGAGMEGSTETSPEKKDVIAPTSINIAKLQAMSMSD